MSKNILKKNTKIKVSPQLKIPDGNKFFFLFASLFFVLLITFITYYPSINNNFTNWDDNFYITQNPLLQTASYSDYFFKDKYLMGNYHPLTMISYSIEYKIAKMDPKIFHIDNLILHLFNTVLVFWFVFLLTGLWQSAAIVAVLFGIHPMHVESVAWISERKDVLYTFFFLTSLISYIFYCRNKNFIFYLTTFLLFILSLLSKGQAVTLSLIILLIDYFLSRPINRKLFFEKIPFFIFSIFFGIIAIIAQKSVLAMSNSYPITDSVFCASFGLLTYLFRVIFPVFLSCFYPFPDKIDGLFPLYYYVIPLLFIVAGIFIYKKCKTNRTVIFSILFFLITIAPVLQLLQIGNSIVSDRYTYIPYIGLFFLFAYLFKNLTNPKIIGKSLFVQKNILIISLLLFITYLSYAANQRCKVWKNSETLWKNELENHSDVDGYNYIGEYYYEQSEIYRQQNNIEISNNFLSKAIENYNRSIKIDPLYTRAWGNKGIAEIKQNEFDSAISNISRGLKISPMNIDLHNWRGVAYNKKGMYRQAINDFKKVIELYPQHLTANDNLGQCFGQLEIFDSAIIYYNKMLEIQPDFEDTYIKRGVAWQMKNEFVKAIKDFDAALKLDPKDMRGYAMRSTSYLELNNKKAALKDAKKAQELGMEFPPEYLKELNK